VHPIQYVLVGLAIASFFLLLLALSEHVAFGAAYLAAALACVTLVGVYLRHVLGGWRRGAGVGGMLGALYAALYGLLASEDNALVLGAVLLFAILAAIMLLTRKVDWYRAAAGDSLPPTDNQPGTP
jgi:inner membrane protein